DEPVGERVRGGIEVAIGLNEAGFDESLAGGVLEGEVDPGLIEISLLGDERVADALVLDDDVRSEGFARCDGEMAEAERSDLDVIGGGGSGALLLEAEDVDVEDALAVGAVAQEVGKLRSLVGELVVGGHQAVAAQPAVRGK